jgi:heme exporter protein A
LSALEARGLACSRGGTRLFRDVSFALVPGEWIAVRGPNGSGKTTLLRALAGLVPLSRGTREAPARTLYLGQRTGLLRGLSARDNLRFLAAFRGGHVDGVGPALAAWGIAAKAATRPIESLSAGEQKRAALARIDVERCDLVLLDEPFGEIDDDAAARLLRAIRVLAGERRSVVIATHGRFELDPGANDVVRLG